MRKITQCEHCHFYANSNHLICVVHPTGVSGDDNNCPDFSPALRISIPNSVIVKPNDLITVKALIEDLVEHDIEKANQILATLIAQGMYEQVEELLKQPLSDFYYYLLRLSQLLTGYRSIEHQDEDGRQGKPDKHSILIEQAKFLISHGTSEVLSSRRRQFLYGDDNYIAYIIALYLKAGNKRGEGCQKSNLDSLLELISASANLDGYVALDRLRKSSYLCGYEYPPKFNINESEQDWANFDQYPPVPFSAQRTIAFVHDRFDIVLDYPL